MIALLISALFAGSAMADGWTQVGPFEPSIRDSHAMAYDSARGVTVMFGGASPSFNNETWEWDGTHWTMRTNTGPSPHSGAAMVYDSVRNVTVLFGGDGSSGYNGETWE